MQWLLIADSLHVVLLGMHVVLLGMHVVLCTRVASTTICDAKTVRGYFMAYSIVAARCKARNAHVAVAEQVKVHLCG